VEAVNGDIYTPSCSCTGGKWGLDRDPSGSLNWRCQKCLAWATIQDSFTAPQGRHPSSQRFHDILDEWKTVHDRKQADYGKTDDPFANVRASIDFGVPGWIGAVIRANDKMRRLQKAATDYLQTGQITMENESIVDSFDDLGVYMAISKVLFEEETP